MTNSATAVSVDEVIAAGRFTSLTSSVIAEYAANATPKQREHLHGLFTAEHASRKAARQSRLLKAARLPAMKSLDGYDFTQVRLPDGFGRDQLTGLDFLDGGGDLVFYGDVGTGKTHLACALVAQACRTGIPARFFTTAGLVSHLRRAKEAGRLDKELAGIGKNRLLVIDEFGYLPIDADGARLLFQVIAAAYEKHSLVITTNLEFARWGSVFGDDTMASAVIDRIVHHGRLVLFTGSSYRVTHSLMT